MNEVSLKRLKRVIDSDPTFKYPDLPDIRVTRTQAEKDEFKQILRELAEPMAAEDLAEFKEATKRQPWRAKKT
jgi:hypothetical protein